MRWWRLFADGKSILPYCPTEGLVLAVALGGGEFCQMANEIELRVNGKSRAIRIPESWDDLGAQKLLLFYDTLFTFSGDEFTATAFTNLKLISITKMLLEVDQEFLVMWERLRVKEMGEAGEAAFLDELRQTIHGAIGGLFEIIENEEDSSVSYSPKLNHFKNLWPILTGPGKGKKQVKRLYYGPETDLSNISIYEMGMAFTAFETYLRTGNADYANQLIAILYRPGRPESQKERDSAWGGDRRQPLRGYEGKVAERIELIKTLPTLVRRVLVFWFSSVRQSIVNEYPKVFKQGGGDGSNYGWGGVLLSVAESGPLGALSEVSDQNYANVLIYLSMKSDQAEEAKKAAEKSSRKKR